VSFFPTVPLGTKKNIIEDRLNSDDIEVLIRSEREKKGSSSHMAEWVSAWRRCENSMAFSVLSLLLLWNFFLARLIVIEQYNLSEEKNRKQKCFSMVDMNKTIESICHHLYPLMTSILNAEPLRSHC
jgi:hypothetical protein